MKIRRLLARCAIVILAFLVAVGLVEISLRMFAPQISPLQGGYFRLDSELAWTLEKNVECSFPEMSVRTNSIGLRDDELDLSVDEFRILGLGDSFTFGATKFEETYLEALESSLNREGNGVKVRALNAGVPSYSLEQSLGLMRRLLPLTQPQLILLGIFVGNDFEEEGMERPEMTVEEGMLLSKRSVAVRKERAAKTHGRVVNALEDIYYSTHISQLIKKSLQRRPTIEQSKDAARKKYLSLQKSRLRIYWTSKDNEEWWENRVNRVEETLKAFKRSATDANIPLVIAIFPDETQVHRELFEEMEEWGKLGAIEFDLERPQRELHRMAEAIGVPCLDPLGVLQKKGERGALYKRNDSHWNGEGSRIVGQEAAQFLESLELISR